MLKSVPIEETAARISRGPTPGGIPGCSPVRCSTLSNQRRPVHRHRIRVHRHQPSRPLPSLPESFLPISFLLASELPRVLQVEGTPRDSIDVEVTRKWPVRLARWRIFPVPLQPKNELPPDGENLHWQPPPGSRARSYNDEIGVHLVDSGAPRDAKKRPSRGRSRRDADRVTFATQRLLGVATQRHAINQVAGPSRD